MFTTDLERVRALFARLQTRQDNAIPFEERFAILRLHFPFEDLLANRADRPGERDYCFYANARGVRHVLVSPEDAEIARKMQAQEALLPREKERALSLLLRLSTGEVVHVYFDSRPIIYGNG